MGLFKYLFFLLVLVAIGFIVFVCCCKNRVAQAQQNSPSGQVPVPAYESKVQTYDTGTSPAYPPPAPGGVSQDVPMATVVHSDLPIAQPLPSNKTEGDIPYYP
jgi:hypothetical protein